MNDQATARSGIQVIARAAAILRVLRDDTDGLSLGQIAERVELPRSTVQRIVGALQAERLVIASSSGGSIRLGPEITALSEATRYNVVEECRLHLSELSRQLGETADLSVLRGAAMIFLDQVPGMHRLRTVSSVGDAFPLTTTANGRSALSLLPEDQARKLVEDEWQRWHKRGDWPAFAALLAQVRETGLACDSDEHTEGISALGGALRDRHGEIYAISVPVPSQRFVQIRPRIEEALLEMLATLRVQLAY
ncbi:IclR family transcriptional regulator [Pararhodobacter sp.]|uniref:IclR family transcriptional regulator n=1 Tax=Pararhodobacter sp. TaxID=2127056 RepID=UPI002AFEB696|nr:IclR family transcriptional regulator [Pararhodobacter sp.]